MLEAEVKSMYQILTLLTGVLSAVMIAANGELTNRWGAFPATVIVHAVGSVFALLLCAAQRRDGKRPALWSCKPRWLYLGGALGVLVVVFQNLAFIYIPVTSVIALMLLGQIGASLVVDTLGLLGAEKKPPQKYLLPGLVCALAGIGVLLDSSVGLGAAAAAGLSFASGVACVLSRAVNAGLAGQVGELRSSLVNHLVGLSASLVLAALTLGAGPAGGPACGPGAYLGGCLGVGIVLLYNITVPRISAYQVTLFAFAGQVFAGILCDLWLGKGFSDSTFLGGLIIAGGILVNMLLEGSCTLRNRRELAYRRRIRAVEEAHWRLVLGERLR